MAEDQMLPADGFTLVAPSCNIVARPAEALAAVSVWCMWGLCWVVVGDALAPGTPAVVDAVDGLAPLAVTEGRRGAALMLAPGTPAVLDAVDGLSPLAVTKGRRGASLMLAQGTPAVLDAVDGLAPLLITFGRRGAALNKLAIGRGACSIKTAISDLH